MNVIEELESLKVGHYICEDCWYSCPKSEDGCCDENADECNCGADYRNQKIDNIIAELLNKGFGISVI